MVVPMNVTPSDSSQSNIIEYCSDNVKISLDDMTMFTRSGHAKQSFMQQIIIKR